MSRYTTEDKGTSGRPTKFEGPKFPPDEVDRMLVYGEILPVPGGSGTNVVYPSYRQIAKRYSVTSSTVSDFSKRRNCLKRRKEFQARLRVKTQQKLVEYRSEKIALTKEDSLRIIDKWLSKFEEAVEDGAMRFDNASDFNTMMRLREFLQGNADSRREIQNRITLEEIQERHKRQLKIYESSTPAERGEIGQRIIEGTEVHETFHGLLKPKERDRDLEIESKQNEENEADHGQNCDEALIIQGETDQANDNNNFHKSVKTTSSECHISPPSATRAIADPRKPSARLGARFLLDFSARFICPHCGEEILPEQLVANPAPELEEDDPIDPEDEEEEENDDEEEV